jgi:hypothetical protein
VLGVVGVDSVLGVVGVDGGVVVGGIGQVELASITDPSGHVLVVGGAGGGVNDWVHDGSVGFLVQSTGGAVPVVQLPAAHVDPAPDVPDANDFVILTYGHVVLSLHGGGGGGVGVIPCSFASCMSQSLVLRFLSRSVTAPLSLRSQFGSRTIRVLIVVFVNVSCTTTFISVGLLNTKLAGTYTVIATTLFPLLSLSTMKVHLKIWLEVSWHWTVCLGGGKIDMNIMHGRLCPVGSMQVGKVWVFALTFIVAVVEPLTMNATNARTKTVISFLLVCIC